MKVLFIGAYINEDIGSQLDKISNDEGKLSVAAIKYTHLIGEGFKHNIGNNVTNLFIVPIGAYPVCRMLLWKKRKIDGNYYIPFINITILKQITISLYVFYFSLRWYFQNKGNEKQIIIFSFLYLPFLIAVSPLKLLRNFYIISFVPDLPEFEFSYTKNKFSLKDIFVPFYIYLSNKILHIADFYVFITKFMKDRFGNQPYHIIEGFTDVNTSFKNNTNTSEKKAIMYAGSLFKKFGVGLLLEAFHEINGDYELWLFGKGDMEKEIESYSQKDPRIVYWGNRPNQEILEFEKKAKLLVNPRFTKNEFTKYSFPSKLMEYMSSGTPVLTTRLLGIPDDYFDKMFYIEKETTKGLKQSLLCCLSKTQNELDLFGENTKLYVLNEKNNRKQIGQLIEIFNSNFTTIN